MQRSNSSNALLFQERYVPRRRDTIVKEKCTLAEDQLLADIEELPWRDQLMRMTRHAVMTGCSSEFYLRWRHFGDGREWTFAPAEIDDMLAGAQSGDRVKALLFAQCKDARRFGVHERGGADDSSEYDQQVIDMYLLSNCAVGFHLCSRFYQRVSRGWPASRYNRDLVFQWFQRAALGGLSDARLWLPSEDPGDQLRQQAGCCQHSSSRAMYPQLTREYVSMLVRGVLQYQHYGCNLVLHQYEATRLPFTVEEEEKEEEEDVPISKFIRAWVAMCARRFEEAADLFVSIKGAYAMFYWIRCLPAFQQAPHLKVCADRGVCEACELVGRMLEEEGDVSAAALYYQRGAEIEACHPMKTLGHNRTALLQLMESNFIEVTPYGRWKTSIHFMAARRIRVAIYQWLLCANRLGVPRGVNLIVCQFICTKNGHRFVKRHVKRSSFG